MALKYLKFLPLLIVHQMVANDDNPKIIDVEVSECIHEVEVQSFLEETNPQECIQQIEEQEDTALMSIGIDPDP